MQFPKLNEYPQSRENIEQFTGYNHNARIQNGQWFSTQNMTTDNYPVASTRSLRSKQIENKESAVFDDCALSAENLGAVCSDESIIQLRSTKDSNGNITGALLTDQNVVLPGQDENSVSLFEKTSDKRSVVKIGGRIAVFPDSIVYDSEEEKVKSIPLSVDCNGLSLVTCVKSTTTQSGYSKIDYYDSEESTVNGYRITRTGTIQAYIDSTNMWLDTSTYCVICSAYDVWSDFSEGDWVEITPQVSAPSDISVMLHGVIDWQASKQSYAVKSYQILEKGTFTSDNDFGITPAYGTGYYIVVSDFIYARYGYDNRRGSYSLNSGNKSDYIIFKRKCPEIVLACESRNRVWGCSADGHEIYACALGNPYNFYDYAGISTDSYAVTVGTNGKFTACCNYRGNPLFFKEHALHLISGSYPSEYRVNEYTDFLGVEKGSERSLVTVNDILYYKSPLGIVAFNGSGTSIVSADLGFENYHNAVAGAIGNKYYISMQSEAGEYNLFVYDTVKQMWMREDDTKAEQFININNRLMYFEGTSLKSVSESDFFGSDDYEKEKDFQWSCETGNYGYSYPNNKYVSRFLIRMMLEQGANASFYIQYDSNGNWERKGEMSGNGVQSFLVPIIPKMCDHLKIKIEGKGKAQIISISKILEESGDFNGR